MKYLLSLPPSLVGQFHELTGRDADRWFCTADPRDARLGSGGGTAWLLRQCAEAEGETSVSARWLAREQRVLIHAGGQSRRLPAYAPSGKVLTPIPRPMVGGYRRRNGEAVASQSSTVAPQGAVCEQRRRERSGNGTLLDEQLPLLDRIMAQAPSSLHTLIASGDVLITAPDIPPIPEADVVCFGLTALAQLAQNHGVFLMRREQPAELDYMLQKPSAERLAALGETHTYLMDIGLWLLSDRAVQRLMTLASDGSGQLHFYDLYGAFGLGLGARPSAPCQELADLSVSIVNLEGGRFLHYGTSRELLSSTAALLGEKPNFVFNSVVKASGIDALDNIWIENSCVPQGTRLSGRNILTGLPTDWRPISLSEGQCLDIVPMGEGLYALRPYGFNDKFAGGLSDSDTLFLEQPVAQWMERRGITLADFRHTADIQEAELFPVVCNSEQGSKLTQWLLSEQPDTRLTEVWRKCRRLSASQLSDEADLQMLNHCRFECYGRGLVREMRSAIAQGDQAFAMLREGLLSGLLSTRSLPRRAVLPDQIVCAQSPVRADVAGGWTDTPPYSVYGGGLVVNFAFNINGQAPLHAYVRPIKEPHIICRSLDLGATEVVGSFEELRQFQRVGSPFSIPKAALALAGFLPEFCHEQYSSLRQQLEHIGCGLDISTLAAVPAGSGLGTSSILAATVLGALSDFCGLGWDKDEICRRTLALEQLLTTGGGWQDQYGGVFGGVKILSGGSGLRQNVLVETLPSGIFLGEQASCHLMYYTGITRTAKQILVEIVKGMFRQDKEVVDTLLEMRHHAADMWCAVNGGDLQSYGEHVRRSWQYNLRLDSGTAPASVQQLCQRIDDLCLGYKLLGAGGGGYMYMVAKDPEAAARLRQSLGNQPLMPTARFVDMTISNSGLVVSRS